MALGRVSFWDDQERQRTLNEQELEARKEAKEEFKKWAIMEEISWRQKSRQIWLKEGDKNTGFFHKMANSNSRRNCLKKIKVRGVWLSDEQDIQRGVVRAYQDLLSDPGGWHPSMSSLEFDSIGREEAARLEEMFSVEEVYLALSELNGDKAPGPGWISHCLLAVLLKKVVGKVVSSAQNAFVEGRQILDAALIANEAIDSMLKGDEAGVLCKLDLEKAYDHINWDFLMLVMQNMGFGEKWAGWIRWCISTASFSVMINGSPVGFFQSTRGLRQGDPISPYLFVLGMEALSCLINKASEILPVGSVENAEVLASELGCKVGSLPSTYLGLPLGAPHKSVVVWDGVEERMRKRLALWKRQFILRGGDSLSFGALWLACRFILWPYCVNGAGALRLKEILFGNLLSARSMGKKKEGGSLVRLGKAMGWGLWKEIRKEGVLLLKTFSFTVGDGGWNPCFSRSFNDWELEAVASLLSVLQGKRLNVGMEDSVVWNASKNGSFSVKSLYNTLDSGGAVPFPWRIIWSPCVPTKLDENLEQWPHLNELVQCYRTDWVKDENKYGHYESISPVLFQNQIFEGPDTDIETEMQLASARQIKAEDTTDDDIPAPQEGNFQMLLSLIHHTQNIFGQSPLPAYEPAFDWENERSMIFGQRTPETPTTQYGSGLKISVKVLSLSFQAGLVEPFYGTICLYNRERRDKLSEDFFFRILPTEMQDACITYEPRGIFYLDVPSASVCLLIQLEKPATEEGGVTSSVYSP
ncbi:Guanine nucleotide exchange factor SPIKE 1 [Vitis vinifera]|uniref:Guanine nucleotide exchange factor SPIKE 1 n=1 Tax=Vitis vinifera TaxID=29760 RepID=A0A438GXV5_VITVI|nr:Guanine nucleotide exchange factor SPIKE 1 [Vitis vinifera]